MAEVRRLSGQEIQPSFLDKYTYKVSHKLELASYDRELTGKSWASLCGHMAHDMYTCETILIFRERDNCLVLRYDRDGFDL